MKINPKLLTDKDFLFKPNFHELTVEDMVFRACLLSYIKHGNFFCSDDIGWNQLHDTLHNAICNVIGDDEYVKWGEMLDEQEDQTGLDYLNENE